MDQPPPDSPHSHPLPYSLPDSGLQGILDANGPSDWLNTEATVDLNTLGDFYFCSSEPTSPEWIQETNYESSHAFSAPGARNYSNIQNPGLANHLMPDSPVVNPETTCVYPPQPPDLTNVSQWLDGAYRPPVPCNHCRKHRLHCLIIRTTSVNPNPLASCSSCVALFRECSLAKGEKRLPSGFETFTPVLGHLHGLPEQVESVTRASSSAVEHPKERKEPKHFARKGARILREWFYQNQEHPYPNEDQKDQLSQETGFSQKRISTWFANARRRQKQKANVSNLATDSRPRAGSPLVTSTLDSMTPMERWQASPPEDEPVPESVIQDAIADIGIDAGMDPSHFDVSAVDLFHFDQVSSHLASSVSSFGSRASETSESVSSAWSHQSGGHGFSFPLLPKSHTTGRQRGQRVSGEAAQYQCTFCTRSFRKRHDWSRHEKSVHLSLDTWVCTPNLVELQSRWASQVGDGQQYSESEVVECHFCDAPFPGPDHWEHHEFHVCAEKPLADRTFSRKDYLWQHLRKFHGCTKMPVPDLDAWRAMGANVQSRCGFCDRSLPTWAARSDHLAEHFKKEGARMEQWVGDWGLDVSAMSALRNAVLPFQRSLMRSSG